jgi:hypothetical protein
MFASTQIATAAEAMDEGLMMLPASQATSAYEPEDLAVEPMAGETEQGSNALVAAADALVAEQSLGRRRRTTTASTYLPGLTKTGKRRRKHPVAEVKGGWTADEDLRLEQYV